MKSQCPESKHHVTQMSRDCTVIDGQLHNRPIGYAKVGQPKSNNQKVMCHQSVKFSDMSDQTLLYTFNKISGKINVRRRKNVS